MDGNVHLDLASQTMMCRVCNATMKMNMPLSHEDMANFDDGSRMFNMMHAHLAPTSFRSDQNNYQVEEYEDSETEEMPWHE